MMGKLAFDVRTLFSIMGMFLIQKLGLKFFPNLVLEILG